MVVDSVLETIHARHTDTHSVALVRHSNVVVDMWLAVWSCP